MIYLSSFRAVLQKTHPSWVSIIASAISSQVTTSVTFQSTLFVVTDLSAPKIECRFWQSERMFKQTSEGSLTGAFLKKVHTQISEKSPKSWCDMPYYDYSDSALLSGPHSSDCQNSACQNIYENM